MAVTKCFHCELPVPKNCDLSISFNNSLQAVCCPGCKVVAELILSSKMQDFYKLRQGPILAPDANLPNKLNNLEFYDNPKFLKLHTQQKLINNREFCQIKLSITGIACSACVWLIEQTTSKLSGVKECLVNFSNHNAIVTFDPSSTNLSSIVKHILSLGYKVEVQDPHQEEQRLVALRRKSLIQIGVAFLGMMQVMMFAIALYLGDATGIEKQHQIFIRIATLVVTTIVLIVSARPFFISALNVLKAKSLNMDVPISLAISVAYVGSIIATINEYKDVYFDSVCMFVFFLLLGRFLEMSARLKATQNLRELNQSLPQQVTVVRNNIEKIISYYELNKDDVVIVKPGEVIPADGIIIEGNSTVNESLLTGESRAISKNINDNVLAASVNISQPIMLKTQKIGGQSFYGEILNLLERAQAAKPATVLLTDKIAKAFVAFILSLSFLVGTIWYFVQPDKVFEVVLSILIVACPCALSLAIPVTLTVAINSLAKRGFIIAKANTIEILTKITNIVFDKTGTLTQQNINVSNVEYFIKDKPLVLNIAFSLERNSSHPVAVAITNYAKQNNTEILVISSLKHIANKGIQGVYANQEYRIGKYEFVKDLIAKEHGEEPSQKIYLAAQNQGLIATFTIQQTVALKTKQAISTIEKHYPLSILSGDNEHRVQEVARQLNLKDIYSEQSPQQKMQIVKLLQSQGNKVLMVGDGLNDAPCLSQADLAIAMGTGASLTKLNSDAIILNDDLNLILVAIKTSKFAKRIITQNIVWALGYNMLAIPFAAFGNVPPYLAAIGMSTSSLLVVLNALRLRKI